MAFTSDQCQPGRRVRVIQQMPQVDQVWTNTVEGVIMRFRQSKTGSWYAHARDDRLWLDRLELRKEDGELVTLVLDRYSQIETLGDTRSNETNDEPDGFESLNAAASGAT
jgi:hypothetical protein